MKKKIELQTNSFGKKQEKHLQKDIDLVRSIPDREKMFNRRRCFLRLGRFGNAILFWMGMFLPPSLHAAAGPTAHSPSEVLLVYNSNSPISTAIANYYKAKRGVTNVLAINCEDSALSSPRGASNGFCGNNEIIPFASYTSQIETPVSNYLASHSSINPYFPDKDGCRVRNLYDIKRDFRGEYSQWNIKK